MENPLATLLLCFLFYLLLLVRRFKLSRSLMAKFLGLASQLLSHFLLAESLVEARVQLVQTPGAESLTIIIVFESNLSNRPCGRARNRPCHKVAPKGDSFRRLLS